MVHFSKRSSQRHTGLRGFFSVCQAIKKAGGKKNRLLHRLKAKYLEESKQFIFFVAIKQSKYHEHSLTLKTTCL
jgi:hypothetical protein